MRYVLKDGENVLAYILSDNFGRLGTMGFTAKIIAAYLSPGTEKFQHSCHFSNNLSSFRGYIPA